MYPELGWLPEDMNGTDAGRRRGCVALVLVVAGMLVSCLVAGGSASTGDRRTSQVSVSQTGTPISYIMEPGHPYAWHDMTGATRLSSLDNQDDSNAGVTIPFPFTFYNETFTTAYVCTNGFLSFQASSTWSDTTFPSSGSNYKLMIAPFLDDLRAGPGAIYVKTFTTPARFVVEWRNINHYNGNLVGTFQAVLFDTGDIQFNYQAISYTADGYTCGINQGDGQRGNRYLGLSSSTNLFSIRFTMTGGNRFVEPFTSLAAGFPVSSIGGWTTNIDSSICHARGVNLDGNKLLHVSDTSSGFRVVATLDHPDSHGTPGTGSTYVARFSFKMSSGELVFVAMQGVMHAISIRIQGNTIRTLSPSGPYVSSGLVYLTNVWYTLEVRASATNPDMHVLCIYRLDGSGFAESGNLQNALTWTGPWTTSEFRSGDLTSATTDTMIDDVEVTWGHVNTAVLLPPMAIGAIVAVTVSGSVIALLAVVAFSKNKQKKASRPRAAPFTRAPPATAARVATSAMATARPVAATTTSKVPARPVASTPASQAPRHAPFAMIDDAPVRVDVASLPAMAPLGANTMAILGPATASTLSAPAKASIAPSAARASTGSRQVASPARAGACMVDGEPARVWCPSCGTGFCAGCATTLGRHGAPCPRCKAPLF